MTVKNRENISSWGRCSLLRSRTMQTQPAEAILLKLVRPERHRGKGRGSGLEVEKGIWKRRYDTAQAWTTTCSGSLLPARPSVLGTRWPCAYPHCRTFPTPPPRYLRSPPSPPSPVPFRALQLAYLPLCVGSLFRHPFLQKSFLDSAHAARRRLPRPFSPSVLLLPLDPPFPLPPSHFKRVNPVKKRTVAFFFLISFFLEYSCFTMLG